MIIEPVRKNKNSGKIYIDVMGKGEVAVCCADILYFEAQQHKVRMCTVWGDYECREGITRTEDRFEHEGFYRIHRGYLVNFRFVREIYPEGIIMQNGDNLCISRKKYTQFRKAHIKWTLK